MKRYGPLLISVGISLALNAFAQEEAEAPIYRWKDANGQVNYGVVPPAGSNAEPIGGRGTVSVIPAPPALTPGAIEARQQEYRQQRSAQLQAKQTEEQRRRTIAEERQERLAECEERYGTPCDESGRPIELVRRSVVYPGWRNNYNHWNNNSGWNAHWSGQWGNGNNHWNGSWGTRPPPGGHHPKPPPAVSPRPPLGTLSARPPIGPVLPIGNSRR